MPKTRSIKQIPKLDRPREKLMRYGPSKLSSSELLALVLGSGKKGKNSVALGHELIKKRLQKNPSKVTLKALMQHPGIGMAKACKVLACLELGERFCGRKKTQLLLSPQDVWDAMKDFRHSKKEHCVVFYLDVQSQVIQQETVSIGSLDQSVVHPREVFECAIKHHAAQILLAHNHPSGVVNPSNADIQLTHRLVKAGKILGIQLVDHVIVGATDHYSFKRNRLLL